MSGEVHAIALFRGLRDKARALLRKHGEKKFQWWIDTHYKYPLHASMPSYDVQYDRSPLSRAEEQEIMNALDRRAGKATQRTLDFGGGKKAEKPKIAKPVYSRVARKSGKQTAIRRFLAPKVAKQRDKPQRRSN